MQLWFKRAIRNTEENHAEERTSRYRREKDAAVKANSPDTAVDTPGSAASTRRTEREKGANWGSVAASLADNIHSDYIRSQ